jgi:hypothetical protein
VRPPNLLTPYSLPYKGKEKIKEKKKIAIASHKERRE